MKAKKVRKLMLSSLVLSSMVLGNVSMTLQVEAEDAGILKGDIDPKDGENAPDGGNTTGEEGETNPNSDGNGPGEEGETNPNSDENGPGEEGETNPSSDGNGPGEEGETNPSSDGNGSGEEGETDPSSDGNEPGDEGESDPKSDGDEPGEEGEGEPQKEEGQPGEQGTGTPQVDTGTPSEQGGIAPLSDEGVAPLVDTTTTVTAMSVVSWPTTIKEEGCIEYLKTILNMKLEATYNSSVANTLGVYIPGYYKFESKVQLYQLSPASKTASTVSFQVTSEQVKDKGAVLLKWDSKNGWSVAAATGTTNSTTPNALTFQLSAVDSDAYYALVIARSTAYQYPVMDIASQAPSSTDTNVGDSKTVKEYVQKLFSSMSKSVYMQYMTSIDETKYENLFAEDKNLVAKVGSVSRITHETDATYIDSFTSVDAQDSDTVATYKENGETRYSIKLSGDFTGFSEDDTYIFWAGTGNSDWKYVGQPKNLADGYVQFLTSTPLVATKDPDTDIEIPDPTYGTYIVVQLTSEDAAYKVENITLSKLTTKVQENIKSFVVEKWGSAAGTSHLSIKKIGDAHLYDVKDGSGENTDRIEIPVPDGSDGSESLKDQGYTYYVVIKIVTRLDENKEKQEVGIIEYLLDPTSDYVQLYNSVTASTKENDKGELEPEVGEQYLLLGVKTVTNTYSASTPKAEKEALKTLLTNTSLVQSYVNQYVELGDLTEEEKKEHPLVNALGKNKIDASVLFVLDLVPPSGTTESTVKSAARNTTNSNTGSEADSFVANITDETGETYQYSISKYKDSDTDKTKYSITLDDQYLGDAFNKSDYVSILSKVNDSEWKMLDSTVLADGKITFTTDTLSTFAIVKFSIGDSLNSSTDTGNTGSSDTSNLLYKSALIDGDWLLVPSKVTAASVDTNKKVEAQQLVDTLWKNGEITAFLEKKSIYANHTQKAVDASGTPKILYSVDFTEGEKNSAGKYELFIQEPLLTTSVPLIYENNWYVILHWNGTEWEMLSPSEVATRKVSFESDTLSPFVVVQIPTKSKSTSSSSTSTSTPSVETAVETTVGGVTVKVPEGYIVTDVSDETKAEVEGQLRSGTVLSSTAIQDLLASPIYTNLKKLVDAGSVTLGDPVLLVTMDFQEGSATKNADGKYELFIQYEGIKAGGCYVILHKNETTGVWEPITPSKISTGIVWFESETLSPFALVEIPILTTSGGVGTGDATSLMTMAMWAATGMASGVGAVFTRKRKKKYTSVKRKN